MRPELQDLGLAFTCDIEMIRQALDTNRTGFSLPFFLERNATWGLISDSPMKAP